MADFIRKNIKNEVLLMPMRGITIADGTDTLTIMQIEKESSFKITPVTRTNDIGKQKTIAYDFTANIYVMHNNFGTGDWINAQLARFVGKPVTVSIPLGKIANWVNKPSALTDHNTAAHIKPINVTSDTASYQHYINTGPQAFITFELESVEYRPRLIIRVEATVKDFLLNRALSDETTTTGNLKIITNTLA